MKRVRKTLVILALAMVLCMALALHAFAGNTIVGLEEGTINIGWAKHMNNVHDSAFTQELDEQYGNGSGDHIQLAGNTAKFFGYDEIDHIDYLYYQEKDPGRKTFSFSISADDTTNYHSLNSIAFLMNCVRANGKYTGYMFSIEYNQMAIRMLNDVDLDNLAGDNLISSCPSIDSKSYSTATGDVFNVRLVSELRAFTVTVTNAKTSSVVYSYSLNLGSGGSKPNTGYDGGNDFGLLCAYQGHDCYMLSRATYQNVTLTTGSVNEILDDELTGLTVEVGVGILPKDTVFVVAPVAKEEFPIAEEFFAETADDYVMYDISFENAGEKIQPNGHVKVTAPLPGGFVADRIAVFHFDAEGNDPSELPITISADQKHLSFESDSFSIFSIALLKNTVPITPPANEPTKETPVYRPQTDDTTDKTTPFVLLFVSASGLILLFIEYRRSKGRNRT